MNLKPVKYGCWAMGASLAELLLTWGGTAIALSLPENDWHLLKGTMIQVYFWGFVSSIVLAVVGLFRDARRIPAMLALVLTVVSLGVCSIPVAY